MNTEYSYLALMIPYPTVFLSGMRLEGTKENPKSGTANTSAAFFKEIFYNHFTRDIGNICSCPINNVAHISTVGFYRVYIYPTLVQQDGGSNWA
jgi:hypothetical protein